MSDFPQDLIVLSDLHMGRGRNHDSGRHFRLEAFFYDDDLLRFCQYLCAEADRTLRPFKLIFNGDAFDFLRIDPEGAASEADDTPDPSRTAATVRRILEGHPRFLDALATVVLADHDVVFLPGNHDIELQWAPVQDAVRAAVQLAAVKLSGDPAKALAAMRHLSFQPWFYHEPGRVWIEHGCQYDPENAFRSFLRSGAPEDAEALAATELDMPLGNFFQRYLYNGFGPITFIVPTTRANFRYGKWLLMNDPRLLVSAFTRHGPFAWEWMKRMTRRQLEVQGTQKLKDLHAKELRDLGEKTGLRDSLEAIDMLKSLRGDVVSAVRSMLRDLLRTGGAALAIGLLVATLWYLSFEAMRETSLGLRVVLFLTLNFVFMAAGMTAVGVELFRERPSKGLSPMVEAAQQISQRMQVPIVAFGHTHEEAVQRLDLQKAGRSWYFNTGTWIAVFTHDVLLPRERVQFTFLRIRGDQAELLHWSPVLREPAQVVLIDEA